MIAYIIFAEKTKQIMCKYQRVNLVCGFISFVISAVVYILTVEPSASFWDCPEFILSASRLEVGHPPGAPFFMLAGNVFSLCDERTSQCRMYILPVPYDNVSGVICSL